MSQCTDSKPGLDRAEAGAESVVLVLLAIPDRCRCCLSLLRSRDIRYGHSLYETYL